MENIRKNNHSIIFIAVNIFVALLGFIRSFVFMKIFDFKDLGILTLVVTGASLIGLFQIGLINGGYRIISLQNNDSNSKVNNVIFSYFGVLTLFLSGLVIILLFFEFISNWVIVLLVITIGIFSLITNWFTNTLIGGGEYFRLNIANGVSALASLVCLVLAYYFGLIGAISSLLIQPLLFVFIIFFTDKKEIPTAFDFDLKYLKYILSFGFIPFLSGIFLLLYQQIERWSVNSFLGPEALGKMYLVFLTTTLWLLIPTSINSLFFPKAVKSFAEGNRNQLNKIINQYFLILILYCVVCSILMIIVFPPLVKFIFPKHYVYIKLVFIVLPGLLFRNMSDPIGLLLNSMVKLKPILWSDIISSLCYCAMILFLVLMKIFSLENILICYVLYCLIKFIYLFLVFLLIKKEYQI